MIIVALLQSVQGEKAWADWLTQNGYGKPAETHRLEGGDPANLIVAIRSSWLVGIASYTACFVLFTYAVKNSSTLPTWLEPHSLTILSVGYLMPILVFFVLRYEQARKERSYNSAKK